jgi:peroxiredoxin
VNLKRLDRLPRWQLYSAVLVLSFPLALGIRLILQKVIPENLARGAIAYVREENKQPLSEPLVRIFADTDYPAKPAQPHPLLDKRALDFTLFDDQHNEIRLDELWQRGPAVLVFYYGYHCSHCVAQLFSLDEDINLFNELGARVVAISADPPEMTAKRFAEYGRFHFTVLSDPDHRVGRMYGVYEPPSADQPERKAHATFLIDRNGRVFWVNYGPKPFVDNKTLLLKLGPRQAAPELGRQAAAWGKGLVGLK